MSSPPSTFDVRMILRDLTDIPFWEFPAPYRLDWYRTGGEREWTKIHEEADPLTQVTPELYRRQFGWDEHLLSQRQCFIRNAAGEAVGTASAWVPAEDFDARWGRVHWVAIVPRCQGQGLAKPLMTAVLKRLRDLGHTRAYLTTSTARIPAIRLYRLFRFEPDLCSEADRLAWARIRPALEQAD